MYGIHHIYKFADTLNYYTPNTDLYDYYREITKPNSWSSMIHPSSISGNV